MSVSAKPKRPYHAKSWQVGAPALNPRPGEFGPANTAIVKRYQTPGPGPSSGIKRSDLELSKVDRAVEDIRGIIHTDASQSASEIRFELSKITKSIRYLKERQ